MEKIHKHEAGATICASGAVVLRRLGEEASLLCSCAACCPVRGASQLCLERAFSKGLVGVGQRAGAESVLMVVRLIVPSLTLATVYVLANSKFSFRFCTLGTFKINANDEGGLGLGLDLLA